jgi:Protein of unknown function (DUF2938)
MTSLHDLATIAFIGLGATAVMDLGLAVQKRLGMRTLDLATIGRWAGHLLRGRFAHAAIAQATPIAGERAWGWLIHYAVGVAFAGLLVAVQGPGWLRSPSLLPAVAVGVGTAVLPLFVMQPAMGAGFAASRTPTPLKNCARSLVNHAVFGLGLYFSAVIVARVAQ